MRILLITQYFHPENFKSSDIAFELAKRGHKVDALVGIPNYPQGKYFKGYGLLSKRHEIVEGVNVYRCFQTPRGKKASPIGLSLNYISYVVSAVLWVLCFFAWKKKYDAIISHEPSPITQIIPAIILGKIRKTPVYSWILDIWPDSFVSSIPRGKAKFVVKCFSNITEWIYRNSKKILVTSPGMMPLVNRNHDYSEKLILFPNWCDDIMQMPVEENVIIDGRFILMMAGNIADGIGLPYIIPVIDELKDLDGLTFVFVGGGAKQQELRDIVIEKDWKHVVLTGQVPFSKIPSYYNVADAMLLSLKKTDLPHLKATIPARLQSYMAAGKPVIAMIDEGARELISRADCGYCVPAGDSKALADLIRNVVNMDKAQLGIKGENGRHYFEKHFTKEQCISNLEDIIS